MWRTLQKSNFMWSQDCKIKEFGKCFFQVGFIPSLHFHFVSISNLENLCMASRFGLVFLYLYSVRQSWALGCAESNPTGKSYKKRCLTSFECSLIVWLPRAMFSLWSCNTIAPGCSEASGRWLQNRWKKVLSTAGRELLELVGILRSGCICSVKKRLNKFLGNRVINISKWTRHRRAY